MWHCVWDAYSGTNIKKYGRVSSCIKPCYETVNNYVRHKSQTLVRTFIMYTKQNVCFTKYLILIHAVVFYLPFYNFAFMYTFSFHLFWWGTGEKLQSLIYFFHNLSFCSEIFSGKFLFLPFLISPFFCLFLFSSPFHIYSFKCTKVQQCRRLDIHTGLTVV